jgi:hypothetical protein
MVYVEICTRNQGENAGADGKTLDEEIKLYLHM